MPARAPPFDHGATALSRRCTSTATAGGIVLVKMGPFLVLAVYSEPTTAAQAVPYVHRSVDDLAAAMGT